ncbi:MAG: O-antigen ligase family protein [Thermoleophilaceae bacterium]|nr:O-antigen ligase family protein [Thermoleophilaceae bacterium]
MPRSASYAASAGLALALAAVAFAAKGGNTLERATWVEMVLVIAGGLIVGFAVVYSRGNRLYGGATLALFALLAAVTVLSILWSIQPELSWIEANRTIAYLAVFAAAVGAVRLFPGGWDAVLRGVLGAAAIVVGYALLSRIFPAALAESEIYARIGAPYGYWNAVGATAALGLPLALWLGARRSGHPPANAFAYPLVAMFLLAIFLSYSRGSLAAAGIGAALWIGFVPLRLRSITVLAVGAAGAAPVLLWALSKDAFTKDLQPVAVRSDVAVPFGILVVAMLLGLLALGAVIGFVNAHHSPATDVRKRAGIATIGVAAAIPLLLLTSLAISERGIGGTISERAEQLTSESAKTPGGPGRLTVASSSRGRYWRQAGRVFKDRPALGTGAGTFGLSRLRYRKDALVSRHAHGYVVQTMADMGLVGLFAVLALGLAWLVAAARTVGAWPRARGEPWTPERMAVAALALSAVVFGIHSAIDWTWFVPGPTAMALVGAGWVAGRGPVGGWITRDAPACLRWPLPKPDPARLMFAGAIGLLAVVCAWAVWQPLRSDQAADRAIDAIARKDLRAAAGHAQAARDINPLSPRALWVRSEVEANAGDPAAGVKTLERAVARYPNDAETWLRLAEFRLGRLGSVPGALEAVRVVQYLDPNSPEAGGLAATAAAQLSPPPPEPEPTPTP